MKTKRTRLDGTKQDSQRQGAGNQLGMRASSDTRRRARVSPCIIRLCLSQQHSACAERAHLDPAAACGADGSPIVPPCLVPAEHVGCLLLAPRELLPRLVFHAHPPRVAAAHNSTDAAPHMYTLSRLRSISQVFAQILPLSSLLQRSPPLLSHRSAATTMPEWRNR